MSTHDRNPDLAVAVRAPVDVGRAEEGKASSGDDAFEKVKVGVADRGVGKGGDSGGTRPRDDGNEKQGPEEGTLDAVQKKESREHATDNDAEPNARVLQDVAGALACGVEVLWLAACELEGSRSTSRDDVQSTRAETDDGQEETDTAADSGSDGAGNETGEPLTETKDGEEEEDDALEEDGGKSLTIRDRTGTLRSARPAADVR